MYQIAKDLPILYEESEMRTARPSSLYCHEIKMAITWEKCAHIRLRK